MEILDCTIRDGGYYNNWDFSDEIIETYIESFNKIPVDYIEVGYRSSKLSGYLGQYFYTPKYVLEIIKSKSNKKIVILIDEKNIKAEDLENVISPCKELIDMVRIAVDPKNILRAIDLAKSLKCSKFKVAFNVMYMSKWDELDGFYHNLTFLEGIVDYFYMVDSYGSIFPNDVRRIIETVRKYCNVKLGFHGHNNLELALVNTLTALDSGVDVVDATVTGMGRGAGNLKLELLLTVLDKMNKVSVDYNALSSVVGEFENLKDKLKWGTNLPYMVSGANSLPQKEVMEWVSQRAYSLNSIIQALDNKKKGKADNIKLPILDGVDYENVIIVGGGPSAVLHKKAIRRFIKMSENICIIHASSKSANLYSDLSVEHYFCLVGNEGYRMERVLKGDFNKRLNCVLPPYPREMGTYIPDGVRKNAKELSDNIIKAENSDSHTSIALNCAKLFNARNIFIVGYDGYDLESITTKEYALKIENEKLFEKFTEENSQINICSLVPTKYASLKVESIYKFLV